MKQYVINFNQYENLEAFHDNLAKLLGWDDFYGKNLDALYDSISEYPKGSLRFCIVYGGAIELETQKLIARILNQY